MFGFTDVDTFVLHYVYADGSRKMHGYHLGTVVNVARDIAKEELHNARHYRKENVVRVELSNNSGIVATFS